MVTKYHFYTLSFIKGCEEETNPKDFLASKCQVGYWNFFIYSLLILYTFIFYLYLSYYFKSFCVFILFYICRVSWLLTFSQSADLANCLHFQSLLIVLIFKISWLFIFLKSAEYLYFKVSWLFPSLKSTDCQLNTGNLFL